MSFAIFESETNLFVNTDQTHVEHKQIIISSMLSRTVIYSSPTNDTALGVQKSNGSVVRIAETTVGLVVATRCVETERITRTQLRTARSYSGWHIID